MESVHLGYDADSGEETSLRQLVPPDSVHENDLFGDRQVNPRIGDKFQVEIPPMITGSEYIQLLMNPTDSEYIFHVSHSFLTGLTIPIMWLRNELNNADESVKYTTCKKNRSRTRKRSSEPNFSELNGREELKTKNCEVKVAGRTNLDQISKCTSCSPVPGFLWDPWKDAEKDIFLLGLYIFGKNFFQIKRFIETKEMGDILSFYYGEFYRSSAYRRWTDCRKPRSRKCVYGRKIFSGWRQQELVSRLLPHIPEESQNSLLEVSKSFAEGRTSLESYVFYLQATVGICALVESVGIGKGKEDLTSLTIEPVKTNPMFSVCPTMPSEKACSPLTSTDIIKFLTGDFRLSRAQCNDIFWEAVWPRLLARGWRSEQPRNQGYVSSKDYLVFLMPGVKKFSRRKLVKGDHYFDSVSDILKKVASEPKLLELEAEEPRVSRCNEEDQWVLEELSDQDNPSNHQPHCYLKPLTSNCKLERMKFMVVDSSLVHGGKSSKARELRYLPVHFNDTYKLSCLLRTNEGFELDAANMPLKVKKNISSGRAAEGATRRGPRTVVPAQSRAGRSQEQQQPDIADPYVKDFAKQMEEKFLEGLEAANASDLVSLLHRLSSRAAATATALKTKTLDSKKKMRAEIQSLRLSLEQKDEEAARLRTEISTFKEKVALSESKALQLEKELSVVRDELVNARKDLDVQRYSFKRTLEAEASRLQRKVDSLEGRLATEYNDGVTFSYECLMYALGKEYPDLDMSKLEACVDAYMLEHAAPNQEPRDLPTQDLMSIL